MSFKVVNDVFHGNVQISDFEARLLRHPLLNRLHQILQNSTAFLVFPCDRSSRFEHSLGTMNYTSEILKSGIMNSNQSLINDYIQYMKNIMLNIDSDKEKIIYEYFSSHDVDSTGDHKLKALLKKKDNKSFDSFGKILESDNTLNILLDFIGKEYANRNYIKLNDSSETLTYFILLQSVRIYALFHDIGHLPFSHLFENSLGNLLSFIDEKKSSKFYETVMADVSKINKIEAKEIHEVIGKSLVKYIFEEFRNIYYNEYVATTDDKEKINKLTFIIILFIIEWNIDAIKLGSKGDMNSLYLIISGDIDSDRLDFVQRDLFMSGLLKSTGNIDRIIKMFCLCQNSESSSKDKFLFLPAIQSLNDVEEVLKDRYTLYKNLINHHAVKRSDYILQSAIEEIISMEIDDNDNYSESLILESVVDIIRLIAELISNKEDSSKQYKKIVYKFSQVTDFWLLSLLNQKFIELYITDNKNKLYSLLEELFHNARCFKSLWKRYHEFEEFIVDLGKNGMKILNNPKYSSIVNKNKKLKQSCVDKDFAKIGQEIINELDEENKSMGIWTKKLEQKLSSDKSVILVSERKLSIGIKNLKLTNIKKIDDIKNFKDISFLYKNIEEDLDKAIKFYVYVNSKAHTDHNDLKKKLYTEILDLLNEKYNLILKPIKKSVSKQSKVVKPAKKLASKQSKT